MAIIVGDRDQFFGGKRVEVITIDPAGKTNTQIETEKQALLNNLWPTAAGYSYTDSTATEICGFGFPLWYLKRVLRLISVACSDRNGHKVCVMTITQP